MARAFDRLSNKYSLMSCLVLFCGTLLVSAMVNAETVNASPGGTQHATTHHVTEISQSQFSRDLPVMPDTSRYSVQAVREKLPNLKAANISVQRLGREGPLKDFVADTRFLEWAKRQLSFPKVIKINSGLATLSQISKAVDPLFFEEVSVGVYISRLPILVESGAALLIDGEQDQELRLSQDRGAFLVNDGLFFAIDTRLVGWNEKNNTPSYYKKKKEFRPFFVSWGGSETYIANSSIESFGYFQSKSYGITFTQYGGSDHIGQAAPKGWIIGSEFSDLFYGFYCYEAEDVVLVGNTYRDNILYGIDPHDRSSRLLIADNHVFGTKIKHGIIVSREVNDSWIINNRTHNNKLSGIVLDRNSQRNIIANNLIYQNGGDGITLYESSDNQILNNIIVDSARQGIRVRNSENVYISHNTVSGSGSNGIFAQVKDLSDTGRNLSLDPYNAFTSIWANQNNFMNNRSGSIYTSPAAVAKLFSPNFITTDSSKNLSLKGSMANYQHEILNILYRKKSAVVIEPIKQAVKNNTDS